MLQIIQDEGRCRGNISSSQHQRRSRWHLENWYCRSKNACPFSWSKHTYTIYPRSLATHYTNMDQISHGHAINMDTNYWTHSNICQRDPRLKAFFEYFCWYIPVICPKNCTFEQSWYSKLFILPPPVSWYTECPKIYCICLSIDLRYT